MPVSQAGETKEREWRTVALGDEWGYVIKARIGEQNNCYADVEATSQYVGPDGPKQEIEAHGFLRFDGCFNVSFNDPEDEPPVMTHFCDVADVKEFGEMLERLYGLAREVLTEEGTWRGEDDGER